MFSFFFSFNRTITHYTRLKKKRSNNIIKSLNKGRNKTKIQNKTRPRKTSPTQLWSPCNEVLLVLQFCTNCRRIRRGNYTHTGATVPTRKNGSEWKHTSMEAPLLSFIFCILVSLYICITSMNLCKDDIRDSLLDIGHREKRLV